MDYSDTDRDLAIRTIIGEEGDYAGQTGVAAVILNRLAKGTYGDTLGDVVLAPNQFEPWSRNPGDLLRITRSDPRYVRAGQILDAVNTGQIADPTYGATHFYAPKAQTALGRAAPVWAEGNGVALGSTMFYAPNGPVARKPGDAAPAATNQIPNRPPAFLQDATPLEMAPDPVEPPIPDRAPSFLQDAQKLDAQPQPIAQPLTAAKKGAPGHAAAPPQIASGSIKENVTAALKARSGDPLAFLSQEFRRSPV